MVLLVGQKGRLFDIHWGSLLSLLNKILMIVSCYYHIWIMITSKFGASSHFYTILLTIEFQILSKFLKNLSISIIFQNLNTAKSSNFTNYVVKDHCFRQEEILTPYIYYSLNNGPLKFKVIFLQIDISISINHRK